MSRVLNTDDRIMGFQGFFSGITCSTFQRSLMANIRVQVGLLSMSPKYRAKASWENYVSAEPGA